MTNVRAAGFLLSCVLASASCAGKTRPARPPTPSPGAAAAPGGETPPGGALARFGRPVLAHGDKVMDVDFSPDGRHLAAAGWHAVARVWDVQSGRLVHELGHPEGADQIAYSPDGKLLLTVGDGSYDRTVCLWDSASGERLQLWEVAAREARFAPGGRQVLIRTKYKTHQLRDVASGRVLLEQAGDDLAAFDGGGKVLALAKGAEALVFDPRDGRRLAAFSMAPGAVTALALTPDGSRLAVGADDKVIKIWELASNKAVATCQGHGGKVAQLAFSPDGKRLASNGWAGAVRLWDARSGRTLASREGAHEQDAPLRYAPGGARLLSAGGKLVRLWDSGSLTPLLQAKRQDENNSYFYVDFSPDGRTLAACQLGLGTVRLWSAAAGKPLPALPDNVTFCRDVTFGPRGRLLAAAAGPRVALWRLGQKKHARLHLQGEHVHEITHLALSPAGKLALSVGGKDRILLWDAASGRRIAELARLPFGENVLALAWSADGKHTAVGTSEGALLRFDRRGRRLARHKLVPLDEEGQPNVSAMALTPDGKRVAAAFEMSGVFSFDAVSGKLLGRIGAAPDPETLSTPVVKAMVYAPDGRTLALRDRAGAVSVWDGKTLRKLEGSAAPPLPLRFSNNGKQLIAITTTSGCGEAQIDRWELATGKRTRIEVGPAKGRTCILGGAIAPDGRTVLLSRANVITRIELSDQGKVKALDSPRARQRGWWRAPLGRVTALAFSGDGRRLAAGGKNTMVLVWDSARLPDPPRETAPAAALAAEPGWWTRGEQPCPAGTRLRQMSKTWRCERPDGAPHGPAVRWRDRGRLKERGVYRDGKRHGVWFRWHRDGTRGECPYREGLRHGRCVRRDPRGAVLKTQTFEDGKAVGGAAP